MAISERPVTQTTTPGSANGANGASGAGGPNGSNGAAADTIYGENVVLSTTSYDVVGTRPVRHDGVDKVTGRAIYGADIRLPGLLHGRILRSPHAHARILRLDTSRAEAHPGVRAVVTAADLPAVEDRIQDLGEGAINLRYLKDNILATSKALYKGHAIAAVAATSIHVAEEALKLIDVEYEPLPAVTDVEVAMQPGAPLLHETLRTSSLGAIAETPSNVSRHFRHEKGDLAEGFGLAEVVAEREFKTATVHQGYIEPQTATAQWNADGQLTIWCSTQGAFGARDQCSRVLGQPVGKLRVIPLEIGGGFGGKNPIYVQPVAALLSRKANKPVKVTMTRAEVLQGSGPAPASWTRVKMGATRDGRIVAAEVDIRMEAGAYPGSSIGGATGCALSCYDIPHARVDGYDVVVNKPKSAAYRAPGAPQAAFAVEQVVDELCEQLGMDKLEVRLKNAAKEGARKIDGTAFGKVGLVEVIEATQVHEHWLAPLPKVGPKGGKTGRGLAIGYWHNGAGESSCTLSVNPDGSVSMLEGSVDIGGTRPSIAMQAAEILGLGAYDIKPMVGDTDSIGYTGNTGGSRTTFATGIAAIEAARDVIRQMKDRAARIWAVSPDEVTFEKGVLATGQGDQAKRFTFKELAAKLPGSGGTIIGRANVQPAGRGNAFASIIADVEVDPETGKTQVLRATIVQDAGKAVHPSYVEGQLQGAVVQGIGWALNEEYYMNARGEMTNASLLDYRMPTCYDVPRVDTVIVEVPNPGHPFGVRGVGEVSLVPPLAAIANALHDALGVRLTSLPMNPREILTATGVI
ncbi:MAG: Xanthine dehydrogenase, molybdenum binding subunit [uncultured Chloroflexi bacterium]|uniref:Xanthine dehydrogenase, molybdenum binding subunit n=1 Tax=uncultured Chloroflexota bacterium TaxID=166587 RepID=A0A6J4K829_9CHLR|nr:MAG: Xanthine dehydrogenase, molybdenum binding subunit [uncultured Chloroflexota bacterium]